MATLKSAGKSVTAAFFMGIGVHYLFAKWTLWFPAGSLWDVSLMLVVLVPAGAVIYFGLAGLFRCGELAALGDIVRPITRRLRGK